jgi:hypothetical protein
MKVIEVGQDLPDLINQSAKAIANASNFKLQSSIKRRCIKRSTADPEALRDGGFRKDISILITLKRSLSSLVPASSYVLRSSFRLSARPLRLPEKLRPANASDRELA